MQAKRINTKRLLCAAWAEYQIVLPLASQRERRPCCQQVIADAGPGQHQRICNNWKYYPPPQPLRLENRATGRQCALASRRPAAPAMIPTPDQVWLVVEPIDMRAGIDSLSQRIQNTLGCSPCDGSAYAFRNRRLTRLKLLVWDGTGVWLCQRRLHRGRFTWPTSNATTFSLTSAQWAWLTAGVDWQRLSATPNAHWQA